MASVARGVATFLVVIAMCPSAGASQLSDSKAVLSAVSKNYCSHDVSRDHTLSAKPEQLGDGAGIRKMLLSTLGDPAVVDQLLAADTGTVSLPKDARYACFHLADYGEFTFSVPVFSLTGNAAYVYLSQRCGGLCGHGELYILDFRHGRWHVSRRLPLWVS
jgi:hypothetical protein